MPSTPIDLYPAQQEALHEFFTSLGGTIEALIITHEALAALKIVPVDVLEDQAGVIRALRKQWEYIADNFNTLGVDE